MLDQYGSQIAASPLPGIKPPYAHMTPMPGYAQGSNNGHTQSPWETPYTGVSPTNFQYDVANYGHTAETMPPARPSYHGGAGGYNQIGGEGDISASPLTGWEKFSNIVDGVGGIGKIILGFQAQKLAKQSFNFQKDSYEKNMANQLSSYNMALEDRAHARARQSGQSEASAADYINRHRLG